MQKFQEIFKKYSLLGPHGKFQGLRDVTWVQIIYINKFTNTKKEKINEDNFLIIVRTAALELMYVRTSERNTFLHYNTKYGCPFVSLCVRLKLKNSVLPESIGLNSLGYIATWPAVVLSYFLGEWDTPNPPKWKNTPSPILKIKGKKSFISL